VLIIGLVVRSVAEQSLTVLVTQEAQQRAFNIAGSFSRYYATYGSWDGVEVLFDEFSQKPRPPGSRPPDRGNGPPPQDRDPQRVQPGQFLITDTAGIVVASDNPDAKGQTISPEVLARGASIYVRNQHVGTLIIGAALGILDTGEKQLLETLNGALILTGLLTSVAVIGLALWLSRQLTVPVRDLISGAKQLASGHWSQPLAVRSRNEFADLTDAFNAMAEQLTRQQQQQRQLIADIAHDLRTPLSVIGLELAGIGAGLQTPEQAVVSLQEEVDWLQHLIDDLHTLSLMDIGRITLYPDDIDLASYLRDVCNHWQAMATNEDKTLLCDIAPELPVIQFDPFRIRQVLGNLLNNALQHTTAGTQITVRANATPQHVEISIADTGPGIAPDDLTHIFDRFYRADRSRNHARHKHGSGLGLSIAYQMVQLHGGTLSAESKLGVGTTFTVRLPNKRLGTSPITSSSVPSSAQHERVS
jgi:signal transduction histidine kinase